jgi:hypothetical protein
VMRWWGKIRSGRVGYATRMSNGQSLDRILSEGGRTGPIQSRMLHKPSGAYGVRVRRKSIRRIASPNLVLALNLEPRPEGSSHSVTGG